MSVSGDVGTSTGPAPMGERANAHGLTTAVRRRAGSLSLLGAGALTFAGFLVTPWEGPGGTRADLRTIAAHAGRRR